MQCTRFSHSSVFRYRLCRRLLEYQFLFSASVSLLGYSLLPISVDSNNNNNNIYNFSNNYKRWNNSNFFVDLKAVLLVVIIAIGAGAVFSY